METLELAKKIAAEAVSRANVALKHASNKAMVKQAMQLVTLCSQGLDASDLSERDKENKIVQLSTSALLLNMIVTAEEAKLGYKLSVASSYVAQKFVELYDAIAKLAAVVKGFFTKKVPALARTVGENLIDAATAVFVTIGRGLESAYKAVSHALAVARRELGNFAEIIQSAAILGGQIAAHAAHEAKEAVVKAGKAIGGAVAGAALAAGHGIANAAGHAKDVVAAQAQKAGHAVVEAADTVAKATSHGIERALIATDRNINRIIAGTANQIILAASHAKNDAEKCLASDARMARRLEVRSEAVDVESSARARVKHEEVQARQELVTLYRRVR